MTTNDSAGQVTLDTVVSSVLNELDDYSTTYKKKYLQFAIEGLRQLNMLVVSNISVEYLKVNGNKTVDLPSDYIYYTKIGVNMGGDIWTLTLNEKLAFPNKSLTDVCKPEEEESAVEDPGASGLIRSSIFPNFGYYFYQHFRNGQYVGEMYGIGGGINNVGYFREDKKNRQLCFSSDLNADEIILEYKSSGIRADGKTMVPVQAMEALKSWIHWKRLEYQDRVPLSEKRRKQELYYIQYEILQNLENVFSIDEYLDSTYSVATSTFRR